MADKINLSVKGIGGGRIIDTITGQMQPGIFGRGGVPARARVFTHGTGDNQVNLWHLKQYTLAATSFNLHDLAGGLTDYKGVALTFAKIKFIYVALVTQDGANALRIGPQNQSNPWVGPWGGTGATVYKTIYSDWEDFRPVTGHTVVAGTGDIFPVYNPGASSVTYLLWVLGNS